MEWYKICEARKYYSYMERHVGEEFMDRCLMSVERDDTKALIDMFYALRYKLLKPEWQFCKCYCLVYEDEPTDCVQAIVNLINMIQVPNCKLTKITMSFKREIEFQMKYHDHRTMGVMTMSTEMFNEVADLEERIREKLVMIRCRNVNRECQKYMARDNFEQSFMCWLCSSEGRCIVNDPRVSSVFSLTSFYSETFDKYVESLLQKKFAYGV
jgi:hypothetical protein